MVDYLVLWHVKLSDLLFLDVPRTLVALVELEMYLLLLGFPEFVDFCRMVIMYVLFVYMLGF